MERIIERYCREGVTIEYSLVGEGEPILIFHGGHSNCHEEFGYKSLVDNGYSIITPTRAGYGGTSKEVGESLTEACRHYAHLLDHLQVNQVHVIAISAGGPTGKETRGRFPRFTKTTRVWLFKISTQFIIKPCREFERKVD